MKPVKVASVGVGWWGKVLADAAVKSGALRVVVGASRSTDTRAAFAAKYQCREAESYDAVLRDPEIEAVLLATPHTLHAEQVIAAAEAGKHVFVEKPFALTVADARRATEACRQAGVVLAVGHQRRRHPASRPLKRLVVEGALGRIVQAEGNMSGDLGFSLKPGMWRSLRAETPGGSMTNVGIHHVDTLQYLLGPVARVMAFVRRVAVAGVDIDDTTSVLLEFTSGSLGYLGTSWVHPNRTSYITLHGTEAQAYWEADGARLRVAKRGQAEPDTVPVPTVDPVTEELTEFARCVREGGRPEVGGEEATANIAVLEAIVESAATGRVAAVNGATRA
jgi:predicted dehydrogenase